MKLSLSKRLTKIVEMCDEVDTIIDVGTDHGKVPITLANLGEANNVIAIDNKTGPLKVCEDNAKIYLNDKDFNFKTLLCDGLSKVDKNIECGIIITGMGFDIMSNILSNINEYNYKYLILSPHTKITELIKLLYKLNIDLIEQNSVYEDEKYYYILKAKKHENS